MWFCGPGNKMAEKKITTIVFTRNRPMQLHGYLESIHRFLPTGTMDIRILYKPDRFGKEYEMCFAAFPDCRVVRESDFFEDLMRLIEQADTEYMLFGIDDVVYFDGVSWPVMEAAWKTLRSELIGFSLRHGDALLEQCGDPVQIHSILEETVKTFEWPRGKTSWTNYPFDLCATVYRTETVRTSVCGPMKGGRWIHRRLSPQSVLVSAADRLCLRRKLLKGFGHFFNPNTFESWTCRECQRHPDRVGRRLAFQKHCAAAIQVNMVNTSTNNDWQGGSDLTVEALAEKYRAGWRIDIDRLSAQKPSRTHLGGESFFLREPGGSHVNV